MIGIWFNATLGTAALASLLWMEWNDRRPRGCRCCKKAGQRW